MWFKQTSSSKNNVDPVLQTDNFPVGYSSEPKAYPGRDADTLKKRYDELQKKHKQLQVIFELAENIYQNPEISKILPHVVTAIKSFFPSVTIAYTIVSHNSSKNSCKAFFYTERTLSQNYINRILKILANGMNTIPVFHAKDEKIIWSEGMFSVDIIGPRGLEDSSIPLSQINIPLVAEDVSVLLNISSVAPNSLGIGELNIIYEIINSASKTINHLRHFLSFRKENEKLRMEIEKIHGLIITREATMKDLKKAIELLKR